MHFFKAKKVLELSDDFVEADIKKAYHRLAKEYHPDKNNDPSAAERFKEISDAYQFLMKKKEIPTETVNLFNIFTSFIPMQGKRIPIVNRKLTIKEYLIAGDIVINVNGKEYTVTIPKYMELTKSVRYSFAIVNYSLDGEDGYNVELGKVYKHFPISLKESLIGIDRTFTDPFDNIHPVFTDIIVNNGDGYSIRTIHGTIILLFKINGPKKLDKNIINVLKSLSF